MQMSAWPFSSGPTTPSHPLKMSSETPSQTKEKQSPARWDAGPGRGNSVGLFPIKFPLRALLGWCQINPPLTRLCIKHKYSQTTGTKDAIISECARTFKSKQIFLFFWGMSKMSQIWKEKHWVCLFAPETEDWVGYSSDSFKKTRISQSEQLFLSYTHHLCCFWKSCQILAWVLQKEKPIDCVLQPEIASETSSR